MVNNNSNLLLISYSFPPMQSAGAYRTASFAKHLPRFGFDVTVLTVKINRVTWNGALDKSIKIDYDINRTNGFHIGETVKAFFGSRFSGHGVTRTQFKENKNFSLKKMLGFFYENILTFPDPTWLWYPLSIQSVKRILKQNKPDIVLSSALPITSHLIARYIKNKIGVPWVADYRDLYSQNNIWERHPILNKFEYKIEKRIIEKADAITTVSPPLAEDLHLTFRKPVHIITNGYEPDEFESIPANAPSEWSGYKKNIVYTGMIYPNKNISGRLFDALRILYENKKIVSGDIAFHFYGPNVEIIKGMLPSDGLNDFVIVGKNLPRKIALRYQMASDMLIVFDWAEGVFSSKLFEYIGTNKPILSIGPKGSVIDKTLQSTGLGISENDPHKLSEILYSFLRYGNLPTSETKKSGKKTSKNEFTREFQAGKLANVLNQVLKNHPK